MAKTIVPKVKVWESTVLGSSEVAIPASGGRSRTVLAPGMILITNGDEYDLITPAEYAKEYAEL